jgi:glycerol-3-phosphate dehydrogenase
MVIVGGGVYGCALALEASRRGIRPLLLERDDFGQHTSWNSLRIVHGGIRYLQRLDLKRFFESVAERSWFLAHFPDLVHPLACLMPLYGRGIRRSSVLAAAIKVNDLLSRSRNEGIHRPESRIPAGRIATRDETVALFPAVDQAGLTGGALWYDAVMPDSQRLIIEMLRWAAGNGATALNYVEAERLLVENKKVLGVVGRDTRTNQRFEYRVPVVVNCCGPWSREVAERFDRSVPALFRPSLALNVVLDIEPTFTTAVAVTAKQRGARTYFLYPWKGRTLAGTYHAARNAGVTEANRPVDDAERFLAELRVAVPGLQASMDKVHRILWGLLPVKTAGTVDLTVREVILDHASLGGPDGLFSVSGVKFTMARRVAQKVLELIKAKSGEALLPPASAHPPDINAPPDWLEFQRLIRDDVSSARAIVRRLIEEEAVLEVSDLLLRRTDWGLGVANADAVAEQIVGLLPRGAIGEANAILASEGELP